MFCLNSEAGGLFIPVSVREPRLPQLPNVVLQTEALFIRAHVFRAPGQYPGVCQPGV